MFTGIVEGRGALRRRGQAGAATRLVFSHPFGPDSIAPGDSVAVDGCCLTAVDPGPETFAADLSPETLAKTLLGSRGVGAAVNLERALLPTSRLGGHFVSGHVDGHGELVGDEFAGGAWTMTFVVPAGCERYLAPKGSVAVDGVSLTVAAVEGRRFSVAVIPTTRDETTLGSRRVGDAVHLEMDILAKYVEAILRPSKTLDAAFLARHGFGT